MVERGEGPEILVDIDGTDRADAGAGGSSAQRRTARRVPRWVIVAAVLALAGIVSWPWVGDVVSADDPTVNGGDGAVSDAVRDDAASDDAVSDDAAAPATGSSGGDQPAGAEEDVAGETTASAAVIEPELGAPVAPRAVGLSAVVGDGRRMVRIDLDTGEQRPFAVAGSPVDVSGPWLIVDDANGLVDGYLDVNAPGGALRRPMGTDRMTLSVLGRTDVEGTVWFQADRDGFSRPEWLLVDLSSQEVQRRVDDVEVSPKWFGTLEAASLDRPTYVQAPDAGLFRLDDRDERYERLLTGRLIATTPAAVLVERCREPSECEGRWHDANTGRELERPPVPFGTSWVDAAQASPDGRTVTATDTTSGDLVVFVEGRAEPYRFDDLWATTSISADGRWVAANSPTGPFILDVESGDVTVVPLDDEVRATLATVIVLFDRSDNG